MLDAVLDVGDTTEKQKEVKHRMCPFSNGVDGFVEKPLKDKIVGKC